MWLTVFVVQAKSSLPLEESWKPLRVLSVLTEPTGPFPVSPEAEAFRAGSCRDSAPIDPRAGAPGGETGTVSAWHGLARAFPQQALCWSL